MYYRHNIELLSSTHRQEPQSATLLTPLCSAPRRPLPEPTCPSRGQVGSLCVSRPYAELPRFVLSGCSVGPPYGRGTACGATYSVEGVGGQGWPKTRVCPRIPYMDGCLSYRSTTTSTTPCALPRRLPPTHILNSTASDFQTHRTLRAGPAPRMLSWPPSRDLAAPAPAGSLDSTRATQTPRCGGSRTGAVCHRRGPHFDRLVAAAERCSRSNLAAAISQPRVCRRSSL